METVKIENSSFVRDIHSKAVLNTDKNALNDYLVKREIAKKQNEEYLETKRKIVIMEEELREIKKLLLELTSRDN
jgi:hypothetical protein